MDRRAFIASSAALGVATPTGATIPTDPIINMFAQWERSKRRWYRLASMSFDEEGPEMVEAWAEKSSMFEQILLMKACSLEGLHCQLVVLWEEDGPMFKAGADGAEVERGDPAFIMLARILEGIANLTSKPTWQNINSEMLSPAEF